MGKKEENLFIKIANSIMQNALSFIGLRCPKCGSFSVSEDKDFGFKMETKSTRCKCNNCGYRWDCLKVKISSV